MNTDQLAESEEEILVFAEFEDTVNIENYRSIHVLGITGKNPIIQLDDTIFTGQLENPLGTHMFFVHDPAPQSADPLFDKLPKENVKYLCKAKKYLKMKHTYITPKDSAEQEPCSQPQEAKDKIEPINFKTIQEALDAFKNEWQCKIQDIKPTPDAVPSDHDQEMTDLSSKS